MVKSSKCESAHCIEVIVVEGWVIISDSKTEAKLKFTMAEWKAFKLGVEAGEFDHLVADNG